MILALVTALAGGLGAALRYVVDGAVQDRVSGTFPWGTGLVNVTGSFVLGVITGLAWFHGLSPRADAIVGTGLCGGLTTWSTASWESVRLVEGRLYREAFAHTIGVLAVALAAAAAGMALAAL